MRSYLVCYELIGSKNEYVFQDYADSLTPYAIQQPGKLTFLFQSNLLFWGYYKDA